MSGTFQHLQHRLLHAAGVTQDLNNLSREGKIILLCGLTSMLMELEPNGPPEGAEEVQKRMQALTFEVRRTLRDQSTEQLVGKIVHLLGLIGRDLLPEHHPV